MKEENSHACKIDTMCIWNLRPISGEHLELQMLGLKMEGGYAALHLIPTSVAPCSPDFQILVLKIGEKFFKGVSVVKTKNFEFRNLCPSKIAANRSLFCPTWFINFYEEKNLVVLPSILEQNWLTDRKVAARPGKREFLLWNSYYGFRRLSWIL